MEVNEHFKHEIEGRQIQDPVEQNIHSKTTHSLGKVVDSAGCHTFHVYKAQPPHQQWHNNTVQAQILTPTEKPVLLLMQRE